MKGLSAKVRGQESSERGPCWALLLAAGESRRFGRNKLLAALDGRPVIAHIVDVIARARTDGMLAGGVAVLPAGNRELAGMMQQAALQVAENHHAQGGLGGSFRVGLKTLRLAGPPPVGAAMVFLGDQPRVRLDVVHDLVQAWRGGAGSIIRPRYAERPEEPGHPVILERSVWELAEELAGRHGPGPALQARPELVAVLDEPGGNPDLDKPSDFSKLEPEDDGPT